MVRSLVAAAALLSYVGLTHAVQDCDLDGTPINVNHGGMTAGKSGLIRCKDRDSGQVRREQQIQNGVYMGLVRMYQDGKLFKEHYVNAKGNMEGPAREFAPTGKVVRESVYVDSNEVGLIRVFYPGGARRRIAFNGEGSREAASVEFTESGQLSALRCGDKPVLGPGFDDARACGFSGTPVPIELFDSKGTVRQRITYSDGKRIRWESLYDNGQPETTGELSGTQSTVRRFASTGVKRAEVISLISDRRSVRQREIEYSERGVLVREQRWSTEGLPTTDESYYLNGQPRSKTVYSGSGAARALEITEFHDNGQRAAQGRYIMGARNLQLPTGIHQRFDEKGVLRAESHYDGKGRVARERTWDTAGQPERDDELFEDGSRKAFAK
ncbi:MAG: hypothetical protein EOP81_09840 [Variovorax sp.]|nr:MAG: hypothetical protein EOP81_09840 [Variovorax sp.]